VTTKSSRSNGIEALSNPEGTSMLRRMGDRFADEERAALLALLEERPAMLGERSGQTSWSTIASEVSLRGSALAVWHDAHPPMTPTLALDGDIASADDSDLCFKMAWKQLVEWEESTYFDVVTVLDAEYPFSLRGITRCRLYCSSKGRCALTRSGSRSSERASRLIADSRSRRV
jgi:hypothetical protein